MKFLTTTIMPDVIEDKVVGYLTPPEVYNLSVLVPDDDRNRAHLKASLYSSLDRVLLQGNTKFHVPSPLQSFVEMTKGLPPGEKVYIRYVSLVSCLYYTCSTHSPIRCPLIHLTVLGYLAGRQCSKQR